MAKIRRIIRKIEVPHETQLDERQWPVNLALVVLGAFSLGVSLAYLRFNDPRWWANAWLYLIGIPAIVGGAMLVLNLTKNQLLRRSMQLGVVCSVIVHLILMIASAQSVVFSALMVDPKSKTDATDRAVAKLEVQIPPSLLVPVQEDDRQPEDFERPVETETPEETPKPQLTKEETPEEVSPRKPQTIPVIDPQQTNQPAVVKKATNEQAAPREAETPSKLSRNTSSKQIAPSSSVASVERPTTQATDKPPAPQVAKIERQKATEKPQERSPTDEPTTPQTREAMTLAKKTEVVAPTPDSTATSTLKRQVNQPALTPKSQVDAADAPAIAKRTSETELTPNNVATTKQRTEAPVAKPTDAEPKMTPTTQVASAEKRELEAKPEPTISQNPSPLASRQPRLTPRPSSSIDAPQAVAKSESTEQSQPGPKSTSIARTPSTTLADKPSSTPAAAPNSSDSAQPAARITRTESPTVPSAVALASSASTPSRRTGTPGVASSNAKIESVSKVESGSSSGELSASSTATRKAPAESASASRNAGTPTAESVATNQPTPTTNAPSRAQGGAAAPAVNQTASNVPATGRAQAANAPNVVTRVGNVETNSGPTVSASLEPSASVASASRQNSPSNPGATRTQASLDAPSTAGVGSPLAAGGMTKANASSAPSINPIAIANGSPQRANRVAQSSGSPTNVESPAVASGATGSSDPSAEPARLALSRGQSGTAGAGHSQNLDRGAGAADSPALVASAASRRAEATSAGPPDSALNPSTATSRAHTRASAEAPTASSQAESLASATEGGAPQQSELTASSGASLAKATGNAAAGNVSAAKGSTEVDVGANTIVAEAGRGRASGGGQPELSFDPQNGKLARANPSGAAQASVAADRIAATPEAPMATGGGQSGSLDPSNTLAVRGDATAGTAGGPSKSEEKGPLGQPSTAELLAQSPLSRKDASEGGAPGSSGGSPELEDEEEKAKRLARAARGGPQLALAAATIGDVPAVPMGDGGSGGSLAAGETAPSSTAATRVASGGAASSGGAPAAGDAEGQGGIKVGATSVARAETGGAAASPNTTIGGGTGTPSRSAAGQSIAASSQAETVELAGAPTSGGGAEGVSLQAQGIAAAKTSGGSPNRITTGAIGAAAGKEVLDAFGPAGAGDVAGGKRTASPGMDQGPAITDAMTTGGFGRKSSDIALASAESGKIEVPLVGPASAVAQADLDHGMTSGIGRTASDAGEGLLINLEAPEGVGGLGRDLASDVGIKSRLARPDSVEASPQPNRFVGKTSGGIPALSAAAIIPADSFKMRAEGRKGRGKLPPQTEAAIETGLKFLARYQQPDGSWRLQGVEATPQADPQMVSDTAATALAVLAFQGAGYNHREHKYADVVRGGLDHLVRNQKADGDLFVPLDDESNRSVWLYSHALAALALCESYGMTQDPDLKEPAQKAIDFIVAAQQKERGGWRYAPGIGTDTSVTGAMLVALWSGERSNLKVPKTAYEGVGRWLDYAQASPTQGHLYRYNPNASDSEQQRHGKLASPTMTSLGLLMRLYMGWQRDNANFVKGADYLLENLPAQGTVSDPRRDTYYWYYATQVMYHMGGEHWKKWHAKLHPLLVNSQVKEGPFAGSWNPRTPVPDRWGPHGGRLYVTALNLLSLEVEYRYLPTYADVAK